MHSREKMKTRNASAEFRYIQKTSLVRTWIAMTASFHVLVEFLLSPLMVVKTLMLASDQRSQEAFHTVQHNYTNVV